MTRAQRAALFAGGFLGPFAGLMTSSILPELGASFGIGAEGAAVSVMAFLLPFALTMLVSGRLGARWGASRVMTIAYVLFAVTAVGCALAPSWPLFFACYMFMGVSNAFTSPLIITLLSQFTERARLGRTLGLYSAVAAMGHLSAPLFSGLLAQFSWRYAFLCVAVAAVVLCIGVPKLKRVAPSAPAPGSRSRLSPRIAWICMTNLALGACVTGLGFLVAILAFDSYGSGSAERGTILMMGGVASLVLAPLSGMAVDRWGSQKVVLACLALSACCVSLIPTVGAVPMLAALWAGAIAGGQSVTVAVNKHVLGLPQAQSTISFVQAFKFFGSGLAPVIFLPIYLWQPALSFQVAAAILIVVMALNAIALPFGRTRPEGVPSV